MIYVDYAEAAEDAIEVGKCNFHSWKWNLIGV